MSTAPANRPRRQGVPKVAVVLLNWQAAQMTLRAVERAFLQTDPPQHAFVVENGSSDDSGAVLRMGLEPYGSRVTLQCNERNLGFGGGCNTALREILRRDFDWVWLLNNDAEPEPDCLAALISAASSSNEQPGVVGTLMIDPNGPDQGHFGSWMHPATLFAREVHYNEELVRHAFSWVTAASFLVSTKALKAAGLFDERFFMYWEDADLNIRIRQAGFSVIAAPNARASHVAGTSSRGMETERYLWHFTSQKLFLEKHHPAQAVVKVWLRLKYLLAAARDLDFRRITALLKA